MEIKEEMKELQITRGLFERQDRKTSGNLLKDNLGLHITLKIKLNKP